MIRLEDVHAGYGAREALHGVNLEISAGEMVGLLGPNGSGKSTLLLAMAGNLAPSRGRVLLDGRDIRGVGRKERARMLACVGQSPASDSRLTVEELALLGRYPHLGLFGVYTAEDRAFARQALRDTDLEPLARRCLCELSGGELKRAYLARALAQDARMLLLDEVSAGLDAGRLVMVHDLLAQKIREGRSMAAAIHDINLAALYCSRLIVLKQGRVVLDGPPQTVMTEDNLREIYQTRMVSVTHPLTGAPQAHLAPGGWNAGPRRPAGG
ncbi:MAG: cobalamin transport system ATP-binding protein [Desulfovibrionales bacterium]|nr:cobalamin transport system ATP-binding protein [Desulfovibrionales bacterium]